MVKPKNWEEGIGPEILTGTEIIYTSNIQSFSAIRNPFYLVLGNGFRPKSAFDFSVLKWYQNT